MIVRVAVLAGALLALGGALAGCQRANVPATPWIALAAGPSGLADRSFNAAAYDGLRACARATGARITATVSSAPDDFERALRLLAIQGPAGIVAVGAPFASSLATVAPRYGTIQFAIVGAEVAEPNVESITFKVQDGAFLAGALAALVSHTKRIAFLGAVGGPLLEAYAAGFTGGARFVDPRVRVAQRYVGSFDDAARAKTLANALFSAGSDVVFVVAGPGGSGAVDAVKATRGDYVIGVDVDQDALAPGKILTSVVKGVGPATFRACQDVVAQKPVSGTLHMGLGDRGIGLTDFRYTRAAIGAAHLRRLRRIEHELVAGAVTAPATNSALARFHPVALR